MEFEKYNDLSFSSTIFTPGKENIKTPRYLKSTKSSALKAKSRTNTPLHTTITTNSTNPPTPYPLFSPMRKIVKGKRGLTPASSTNPPQKEEDVQSMDTIETPSSVSCRFRILIFLLDETKKRSVWKSYEQIV